MQFLIKLATIPVVAVLFSQVLTRLPGIQFHADLSRTAMIAALFCCLYWGASTSINWIFAGRSWMGLAASDELEAALGWWVIGRWLMPGVLLGLFAWVMPSVITINDPVYGVVAGVILMLVVWLIDQWGLIYAPDPNDPAARWRK